MNSCSELTTDLLNQAAICATELSVLIALAAGLAFVSPVAVVVMGLFALVFVVGLHKALRRWMHRFGSISWHANVATNRTIETALRGAREVMLYDLREVFLERMRATAKRERTAGALAITFHDSPRQVIEFSAVAMFFGFIGVEAALGHSLQAVGVIASVFIAATFRILPSLSRLAMGAVRISNLRPVFDALRDDLAIQPPPPHRDGPVERLPLARALELRDVGFRYRGSKDDALSGINLSIERGRIVGVVGRSGAGKTTLMELLLGVLEPTQGELSIDGVRLDAASRAAWQAGVGYVPQEPYLSDDTVAANIAFGVAPEAVDMDEVRRAARLAGVAEFIETETAQGYDTPVGDGGTSLSGGQRQRIVIARALYRRPQLLVFDEATSALDNVTETAVHEAIAKLGGETTILVVAHRFTSVRHCQEILVLERGRLVQRGAYEDLARETGAFRELLEGRLGPRAAAE
jgi:ABC-type multidrug transport system fused ATPase/permease subunit